MPSTSLANHAVRGVRVASTLASTLAICLAPIAAASTTALAGGDDGVVLKASDLVITQGTTAEIQIRATTVDLIGGFGFNVRTESLTGRDVRYDGPIFDTSWQGWDNAPAADVRVDAACIFTEDQVGPGDHNLVTIEVDIPSDMPAGTVLAVDLSNVLFFNYDFSVPTLDPQDGSITVVRTSDLDGDGTVGSADLGIMLAQWGGASPKSIADLDADGLVDGRDLGRLVDRWGTSG